LLKPVSIIILNWNGYADTAECLNSLQELDYPNYRVLVVDNGSTDDSPTKIRDGYPWVVLVKNDKNFGFAEGNNIGIREALNWEPEYILLLNNDTVIDKNTVAEMVRGFESDSKVGAIGAAIYSYYQPHIIESTGAQISLRTGRVYHTEHGQSEKRRDNTKYKEVDAISGCAMMIKKKIIGEVGLMDPDFFCYVEDIDWCLRMRKTGYKMVTALDAKVWHKGGRSTGGYASPLRIYYGTRNQFLVMNKNFPIKNPVLSRARNLSIIIRCFLHVLFTSKVAAKEGVPALIRGIQDFFAGKLGQFSI